MTGEIHIASHIDDARLPAPPASPSPLSNPNVGERLSEVLIDIAGVALEHGKDWDLPRLIQFVDLYRSYCEDVHRHPRASRPLPTFRQFVSDGGALGHAARLASIESGDTTVAPPALRDGEGA